MHLFHTSEPCASSVSWEKDLDWRRPKIWLMSSVPLHSCSEEVNHLLPVKTCIQSLNHGLFFSCSAFRSLLFYSLFRSGWLSVWTVKQAAAPLAPTTRTGIPRHCRATASRQSFPFKYSTQLKVPEGVRGWHLFVSLISNRLFPASIFAAQGGDLG